MYLISNLIGIRLGAIHKLRYAIFGFFLTPPPLRYVDSAFYPCFEIESHTTGDPPPFPRNVIYGALMKFYRLDIGPYLEKT